MSDVDAKREKLRALLAQRAAAPKLFPTSFAQERLWFLDRLVPGNPFYNVEAAIPIDGDIDADVLERCVNEIVRRHAALRTTFRAGERGPLQVVAAELHVPLQRIDLRALDPARREDAQLAMRRERARTAFDLEQGPLVITDLLRLEAGRWLFLLHMHHIVSDGWSMGVFSRELTRLYQAFAAGEPSPLPPLPLQYGDFAVWQRETFTEEVQQRELAYWRGQLEGLQPLDLPADRPRPAEQSHRGGFHTADLPPALGDAVQRFCRAHGVTPFMTLLAAFKALLARYTGGDDIAVGTFIASRVREELEALIGFFLNTLALRTRVDPEIGFAALVQRVRQTALGAFGHQSLPFATLVQDLAPERDLSRNPLVQVVFQLQNASGNVAGEEALIDYQRGAAIFDISVTCYESHGTFRATWEYATDLFDAATIERMASHYEVLLAAALDEPTLPLHRLPLMDAAERRSVLVDWNGPALPLDGTPAVTLLDRRAAADPHAPAFIEGDAVISFGALAARSTALALRLAAAGVRPGDTCGACLPRGLDLPVALFAAWRAGAAYLPLDPDYPADRLAWMLEDSRARVLVGHAGDGMAAALAGRAGVPLLDPADADLPAGGVLPAPPGMDAVSHILYTSGSTGRPKAAPSPHRQVLNRLQWMARIAPFAAHEVGCVKTATSFIDSLWELAGPLLQGRPAVMVPQAVLLEPARLLDLLARHRVTRLWLVPSYLRTLLECCPDLGARLPHLWCWVASGEVLPAALQERFAAAHPAATLFNLYGTSEVWDATWFDPRADRQGDGGTVPIGRPIDNATCVVLDRWRQPVPAGVPGELHVGGAALGAVASSPRRVALDIAGLPAQDVWACGDVVRWRADGNLQFIGRTDAELKVRGMRIEPAEVEAVLMQHEGVRAAALLAWPGPGGTPRLVAYVCGRGACPPERELRAFLALRLPAFMLPQQFVPIDAMPHTGSGKIDRNALRARGDPRREPAAAVGATAAPLTGGAAAVAAIWEELLGGPAAPDQNFFAAGGHSLLAAQLLTRIEQRLGVRIELRQLFLEPTVTALGAAVDAARAADAPQAPSIPRAARRGATQGAAG